MRRKGKERKGKRKSEGRREKDEFCAVVIFP